MMKSLSCLLMLLVVAAVAWSQTNITIQTNAPARAAKPAPAKNKDIDVRSKHFSFHGDTRQIVYYDQVVITNVQLHLACERLTINMPAKELGDHPTNAVAETNLDIIYVDNKGQTNHLTADKGIYDYSVISGITNETCTFTGHVTNRTDKGWMTAEPLIYDRITGNLSGENIEMHGLMPAGSGTNASPFDFQK